MQHSIPGPVPDVEEHRLVTDNANADELTEWEAEQRRLTAMFNCMYANDDEEGDEDEDDRCAPPDSTLAPTAAPKRSDGDPTEANAADTCNQDDVAGERDVSDASFPSGVVDAATHESMAPAFAAKAQTMAPLLKFLLLGKEDPAEVPIDALLSAFGRQQDSATKRAVHKDFDVMRVKGVLSATSCQRLRDAVDRERCTVADSVDGLPEHQLRLSRDKLQELVGPDECARLMQLPVEYIRAENAHLGGEPVEDSVAERFGRLEEASVRRYSADTRPFNSFHQDRSRITVNVAVSSDRAHIGGRLLGVYGGRVHTIEREEGEATVHSSDLFHAVTSMSCGTRYSLILFFDPDCVADMFEARVAGVKNRNVRRFLANAFAPSREESDPAVLDMSRLLLK